jgi:DNA-binding CsgD family transcriptional regulator
LIKKQNTCNYYETQRESYLGIHGQLITGRAANIGMGVASLIKEQSYQEALQAHRYKVMMVFLIFFLVMFVLSVVLTNRFVTPIMVSLRAIQNETLSEEYQSGISEIDMLVGFFKERQHIQNMRTGELPPNIAELFETFLERVGTLTVSEKRILHYYIEGYDAADITEVAFLSMSTVRKHSGNIYRKLNISSRDELMLYVDLFRRCDRLGELSELSKSPL